MSTNISTNQPSPNITFGTVDHSKSYITGDVAVDGGGVLSIYDGSTSTWNETIPQTVESLESKVDRLERLVEKLIQQLAPELGV